MLHIFNEKVITKVIVSFWKRALNKVIKYNELSDDILLAENDYKDFKIEEIDD